MKAQPSKWRLITTLTSPLQKRNGRTSVIKAPCEDRKKYVYSTSKHTGFLVALLVDMFKKILQDKSRLKKIPVSVLDYISRYSKTIGLQMP